MPDGWSWPVAAAHRLGALLTPHTISRPRSRTPPRCGVSDIMVSDEIWTSALLASDMTISVLPVNATAFKGVRRRAVRRRPDAMGNRGLDLRHVPWRPGRAFATDPGSPPGG